MQELENHLGVVLFERSARKCELTEAGRMFQRDIPDILDQLEESYRRMSDFAAGRTGHLQIATLGSLAVGVIAQTLSEFHASYPDVPITLHELRNDRIFDWVAKGKVELGIAALLKPQTLMEFETIFSDRLMLLVPQGHALEREVVRWTSLNKYPYIMMSTGPAEHAMRGNNISVPPAFVVEHLATAVALVRNGLGVTVLPSCLLSTLNIDGLSCLPIDDKLTTRTVGVAYRNKAWLSPAAFNFMQMLRNAELTEGLDWQLR
jgi:Transcriptional regulator